MFDLSASKLSCGDSIEAALDGASGYILAVLGAPVTSLFPPGVKEIKLRYPNLLAFAFIPYQVPGCLRLCVMCIER